MKTKLQEIRKLNGYRSAKAAANAAGIPVSSYTHYEQGDSDMSLETAWILADFFNVSLDELVGRTPVSKARGSVEYSFISLGLNDEGNRKLREYANLLKLDKANVEEENVEVA